MKRVLKKNQMIITTLAIMIAVAGYLNFSGNKWTVAIGDLASGEEQEEDGAGSQEAGEEDGTLGETAAADGAAAGELSEEAALTDLSEEDLYASGEIFTDEVDPALTAQLDAEAAAQDGGQAGDVQAADAQETQAADTQGQEVPGEAVLASTGTGSGIAAQAKINREQVRSQNKSLLMDIINNTNLSDGQKQEAVDALIALSDITEREAAAEMLLSAKGFTDVVVNIQDESADVIVNQAQIGDAERAQIEDIVQRKAGIEPENIVITTMDGE